ncbi:hypothetical protein EXIGLDRAFT_762604 [Exidia glandulosa HHB12029]|uniref:Uncharacterized protein n=1 Tax=Exidia glandulosa HHB12029 TaxID=1314781 RepID=A0A165MN47_EXIGL|nr:hypothetical protein EXIGLDRAFT_762604 [Exidia glandulosa HHB12029]
MPHASLTTAERKALGKLIYQNPSATLLAYYTYRPHAERDAQLWLSLDAEGRAEFEKQREKQADARVEHALLCEDWVDYCESVRGNRLKELRAARLSQIHERLCNLGWKEELIREQKTIREHALVEKAELLTEQDWEDMAPDFVRILHYSRDVQAMRLAAENFLEKRCFSLVSWTEVRPTLRDIECNDLFADFQPLFDPSLDSAERLRLEDIALRTFPSSVDLWRNSCVMDIIDICERPPGMDWLRPEDRPTTEEETMAVFGLATMSSLADDATTSDWESTLIILTFSLTSTSVTATATELVRASGLDPETATCKDMDIRDARIVCADCYAVAPRKASAMTWWRCLDHIERQHTGSVPVKGWFALDPDSEQRVRELSPRETVAGCSGWDCRVCGCLLADWNAVKAHFAEQQYAVTPSIEGLT